MRSVVAFLSVVLLCSPAAMAAGLVPEASFSPYYPDFSYSRDWSGFYAGISGTGVWGRSNWSTVDRFPLSGGIAGVTVGYNFQLDNNIIVGFSGDVAAVNISGTTSANCPAGCQTKSNWLGIVRGRVGYAWDRVLPYVTGGAAFGDIRASAVGFPGGRTTRSGWTAGLGVEYALSDRWSLKGEYLFVDLGKYSCAASCGLTSPGSVSVNESLLTIAVTFRFGASERSFHFADRGPKPGDTDDPGPTYADAHSSVQTAGAGQISNAKKRQKKHTKSMKHNQLTSNVPLPPKREF